MLTIWVKKTEINTKLYLGHNQKRLGSTLSELKTTKEWRLSEEKKALTIEKKSIDCKMNLELSLDIFAGKAIDEIKLFLLFRSVMKI